MSIMVPPKRGITGRRVREIIGRAVMVVTPWRRVRPIKSVDQTVPDYEFWDKMRRAKQEGFDIAGLFLKPIAEIVRDWALGRGLVAELDTDEKPAEGSNEDYTNTLIKKFLMRI